MPVNERVARLRARAQHSRHCPDPEAARLREKSLAQTEGDPQVLREAKALAYCYRRQNVTTNDDELLVGGSPTLRSDAADEVIPAVFGRSAFQSPWPVPPHVELFFREAMLSPAGNHTTLDYGSVFAVGFAGLGDRIDARLNRLSPAEADCEGKRHFLTALRIVAEGYIDLSNRYAAHALAQSKETDCDTRRRELRTIASNCRRVPAHPPTTFWEACQAAWFSFFFLPDAPGRVDRYLYPAYRHDMAHGTLTREFAKELLSCLWIKIFESVGATSGVSAHNHLTLGGVGPDGSDASNELTDLCLEVTEELRLLRPQVGLRCHRNTSTTLLKRAVRTLRAGTGNPDLCNDEQIVPALMGIGVRVEDARDFSLSGCHEVIVTGKAQMGSVEGFVNMPKILRMALGMEQALQSRADLAGIGSFQALCSRLAESMDRVAESVHDASIHRDRLAAAQPGGGLQASLVTGDCIENARGYTQGGARYNFCNWNVIGVANLADSLAAIRRLVFDEEALGLEGLVATLASDWDGGEALRCRILKAMPHFGNDEDEVDELAAWVVETFSQVIKRRTPFRGGEYILGTTAGGENMHIEFGRMTGATPDGRKAGEPLADSLGAAQGRDRHGVTALLNSVAKLPHRLLPTATTLNVKLDPKLLDSGEDIDRVVALIRGHFSSGGQQVQFNFVDREMLLEAKRCPEKHADLMVRVAGYSAPFTSLWEDLQDEIIARTGHTL